MSAYICPYCDTPSAANTPTCPGCGAPIDITRKPAASGWLELPPARDMARIQAGRSSVQIEGTIVPVVDFKLAEGDGVYFTHHELLWKDPAVHVQQMGLRGAWKRMLAGLPVHMLTAQGPGRIAFSRDAAGEILAVPIVPGRGVDVREHVFLLATQNVQYDYLASYIWYETREGDEREIHFPIGRLLDRFSAPREPGLLLLHAHGNAYMRRLAPGESVLVKATAFLYKDETVGAQLHFEYAQRRGFVSWFNAAWNLQRYLWLRLTGPGRVAIQSAWAHHHDPERAVIASSGATEQYW